MTVTSASDSACATGGQLNRYRGIVDDPDGFLSAANRPVAGCIWTQTLKIRSGDLRRILEKDGYRLEPVPWHPDGFRIPDYRGGLGNHWAYFAGLFHIQEASSMLPAQALEVRPGERVLDLCAAPGNKTAQMALALKNRGTVVANDVSIGRIKSLIANLNRLGVMNTTVTCCDGSSFPRSAGTFDCVLVDAPCSCEGTSRRHPDIRNRQFQDPEVPVKRQKLLLTQAVYRCRTGGRILYSTCTYAPEENEAVVDHVLSAFPGMLTVRPIAVPGVRTDPGVTQWEGRRYDPRVALTARIWPHHNDTGGFFMALLEKCGDTRERDASGPAANPLPSSDAGAEKMPEAVLQVIERFGIDSRLMADFSVLSHHKRTAYLAPRDHRPPGILGETVGLPFVRISPTFVKLTTAGASALGHLATRNTVDLTPAQLTDYLTRRPVYLSSDQIRTCTGSGHVIAGHAGYFIGLGVFRIADHRIESMFPRHWADDLAQN